MITKDVYKQLEENFKDEASWAVWSPADGGVKSRTGDMSVFDDPNLLDSLHNDYVLIALNASVHEERNDGYTGSWRMFHSDDDKRQQDYKMRYAFKDTPIWGSYMTDIIKNHPDKDSVQVKKHVKENPDVLTENVEVLKRELDILGGKPTLIALGRDVEKWLRKELGNEFNIVYLTHYSHFISQEALREEVLELLATIKA